MTAGLELPSLRNRIRKDGKTCLRSFKYDRQKMKRFFKFFKRAFEIAFENTSTAIKSSLTFGRRELCTT